MPVWRSALRRTPSSPCGGNAWLRQCHTTLRTVLEDQKVQPVPRTTAAPSSPHPPRSQNLWHCLARRHCRLFLVRVVNLLYENLFCVFRQSVSKLGLLLQPGPFLHGLRGTLGLIRGVGCLFASWRCTVCRRGVFLLLPSSSGSPHIP